MTSLGNSNIHRRNNYRIIQDLLQMAWPGEELGREGRTATVQRKEAHGRVAKEARRGAGTGN